MESIWYRHVIGLLVACVGAAACSSGDGAETGAHCGGAATAAALDASAAGGEGGASVVTTNTNTASAPPPAWGPPTWSACLPHGIVTTCAAYCASYGLSCSAECQSPYTGKYVGALTFNNATCTSFFPGGTACEDDIYTSDSARCCCGI